MELPQSQLSFEFDKTLQETVNDRMKTTEILTVIHLKTGQKALMSLDASPYFKTVQKALSREQQSHT